MRRAVVTERVAVSRTGNASVDRAIDEVVRPLNDLLRRQATATGSVHRDVVHGEIPILLTPACGIGNNVSVAPEGYVLATSASGHWIQAVPLRVGDRIKRLWFWHDRASTGTSEFKLQRFRMLDGALEELFSMTVTSGTSYEELHRDFEHKLVDGYAYQLEWEAAATGDRYYGARITYDRPGAT